MMDLSRFFNVFFTLGLRYFLCAGIAWSIWYFLFKEKLFYQRIQPKFPKTSDYRREITYSVCTIVIFAISGILLLSPSAFRDASLFYTNIRLHGLFYFGFAFVLMLFIHDTYFYWIHRLMHHPRLFKYFHLVHHRSVNPSPWAAYAFHPLEALLEVGVIVVFMFVLPLTLYHIVFFFLFMIVYNVYGHLGYELYPKGFNKTRIGRWVNTSVSHNQHHQYFRGNYGLYFLIWDRWMGTLRQDYDASFDAVKNTAPAKNVTGETAQTLTA